MTDKVKGKKSLENPGLFYIVIEELPEDQFHDFRAWYYGQAMPIIEEAGLNAKGLPKDCAYEWDYELWYDYWIKGEIAPLED